MRSAESLRTPLGSRASGATRTKPWPGSCRCFARALLQTLAAELLEGEAHAVGKARRGERRIGWRHRGRGWSGGRLRAAGGDRSWSMIADGDLEVLRDPELTVAVDHHGNAGASEVGVDQVLVVGGRCHEGVEQLADALADAHVLPHLGPPR